MSSTTISVTSAGDDDEGNNTSESQRNSDPPRRPRHIPSREECLQGISALNGLIAMGLMASAKANAIRANFLAILRSHESSSSSGAAQVADADLLTLWRTQPGLIDMIEPLLTAEQLDMLMREVRRDAV